MSRFLKAMSMIGLVELEEQELASTPVRDHGPADADEIERILAETRQMMADEGAGGEAQPQPAAPSSAPTASPVPSAPAPAAASTAPPPSADGSLGGRDFERIYADAAVPESPYPAEKLLRVLEGLMAMDPNTRRAAVMAMDAADDDWTIEDPLLDAQRKIRALQSEKQGVQLRANTAEQEAQAAIAAQEQYKTEATATIRQQIAELEAMLEQELQKVAEEKAGVLQRLEQTRQTSLAESKRLDDQVLRLSGLATTFGTTNLGS